MKTRNAIQPRSHTRQSGFTLAETVMALAIVGLVLGGVLQGYLLSFRKSDWTAHSAAGQAFAHQSLSQTLAARWDVLTFPPIDELNGTNFPPLVAPLNLLGTGTNLVMATNFVTITDVSTNPPIRFINVDCVWRYHNGALFTNNVATYRAPNQ